MGKRVFTEAELRDAVRRGEYPTTNEQVTSADLASYALALRRALRPLTSSLDEHELGSGLVLVNITDIDRARRLLPPKPNARSRKDRK